LDRGFGQGYFVSGISQIQGAASTSENETGREARVQRAIPEECKKM
jgi:hypothetical protein